MHDRGLLDWLLEGDPSVRWRVLRDLADADQREVTAERALIGNQGWGRRLLDRQHASGLWSPDMGPRSNRGLYMPKWISTHYTLLLLARLGLSSDHPAAAAGCQALLNGAAWVPSGGIRMRVRERRRTDGRWTANARATGQVHFELERAGKPSRWVTLHGMKILRWWDESR